MDKESKRKKAAEYNMKYQASSEHYKKYRRMKWRENIYKKLVKYINKHTDDDENDIFDEDDDVATLRKKFQEKYGLKIYKKYIVNI